MTTVGLKVMVSTVRGSRAFAAGSTTKVQTDEALKESRGLFSALAGLGGAGAGGKVGSLLSPRMRVDLAGGRRRYAHLADLESVVRQGGDLLEARKAKLRALIEDGQDVGINARDLAVLEGTFLHQDDIYKFLDDLQQFAYSQDELDALWDYAGLYEGVGPGDPLIGKGPVGRFNNKLRLEAQLRAEFGAEDLPDAQWRALLIEVGLEPLTEENWQTIRLVDQAIAKNTLPRDVTLYRGARVNETRFLEHLDNLQPGDTITDESFMFTGLTEARAAPHHLGVDSDEVQVLFQIEAPKGLPAIHSPYGESLQGRAIPVPVGGDNVLNVKVPFLEYFNKEEIVLARDQPLEFVSKQTREDGVVIINVRAVLPQ